MNANIKRILNLTWKVGLGLIGLAALVIGILIVSVWYEEKYGRDYWNDTTLSENVTVEAYNNNTVRVWNKKKARYTTKKLRWVSGTPERDSLTVFCDKDGFRGYLNVNNGERLETYVIKGAKDSGVICLNGPAARKAAVGDVVVIISYASMDFEEAKRFKPTIVFPNGENKL